MINKRALRLIGLLIVMTVLASVAGCGERQPPDQPADDFGTIGGGTDNETGEYATVGGGSHNVASAYHAVIGGGSYNVASVGHSVIGGGLQNTSSGSVATVGGGWGNAATHVDATVGGGRGNTAGGRHATVGGGLVNTAKRGAAVGGGSFNTAGANATIGGGTQNKAGGFDATVAGGAGNEASGNHATVGGGLVNHATDIYATVGGGRGNTASGSYATVPGGFRNEAAGDYSVASGHRAHVAAVHAGAFLYADSNDFDFYSAAADEFAVRATGGVRLVTAIDDDGNAANGVKLAPGSGSWSSLSDREVKANMMPIDSSLILQLLAELPISTWNYTGQDPSVRHIGPTAQDFYAAFGVGEDDRHINTVDADGVALAAIQGLYQLVQEQNAQIVTLEARLATLEQASKRGSPSPCTCGKATP